MKIQFKTQNNNLNPKLTLMNKLNLNKTIKMKILLVNIRMMDQFPMIQLKIYIANLCTQKIVKAIVLDL